MRSTATVPASLVQRYGLAGLTEWQTLLRHLELSEGFSFVVLLVPDRDGAHVCREALEKHLSVDGMRLAVVEFHTTEDVRGLPSWLLEVQLPPDTGAVWVDATTPVEHDPAQWEAAWREAMARLNQFRNPLQRQFSVPLIFAGERWLQLVLRGMAPDFWSVRDLVIIIEPKSGTERTGMAAAAPALWRTKMFGERAHPDPEYALEQVEKLRGRPDQKETLARLLQRAGLGYLARSQWVHAVAALSEAAELWSEIAPVSEQLAETLLFLSEAHEWLAEYDSAEACLVQARDIYQRLRDTKGEANCVQRLGDIDLRRSEHAKARRRYEEALPLYNQAGDALGEANCFRHLGDIAFRSSDRGLASRRYEESLRLCRKVGDRLGEANCFLRLGDIDRERSDFASAMQRYRDALGIYRQVGDILGEANANFSLGVIALQHSDYTEAQSRLSHAHLLYRQAEDFVGEANSFLLQGDIAFDCSDYSRAKKRYEEALSLYRRIGCILGEANCISRLGNLALDQRDPTQARQQYEASLALYEKIADPYSTGMTHSALAKVSNEPAERTQHLKAAREAWSSIDRQDLVDALDEEFGLGT